MADARKTDAVCYTPRTPDRYSQYPDHPPPPLNRGLSSFGEMEKKEARGVYRFLEIVDRAINSGHSGWSFTVLPKEKHG
jgi:hypothetical protein